MAYTKPTEIKEEKVTGNKPEETIRVGAIAVTIWKNQSDKGEWNSVSTKRSYKDKEGKWQETNTLRVTDIPKMILALNKAYEKLAIKEQD